MANDEHVALLNQGVAAWNAWRRSSDVSPDLSDAVLVHSYLPNADLNGANLTRANLIEAYLEGSNLANANLSGADLYKASLRWANLRGANLSATALVLANLSEADLCDADLSKANLIDADLYSADLSKANLRKADLDGADLTGANLSEACLDYATLVDTNLTDADLTGCRVFGVSAWGLKLEKAKQQNLVITTDDEPEITVDNIEVAQFVYLLLHNEKIRDVIDTIGKKGVLLTEIILPTSLITAVQEQRAILFLGAGASYDAVHPKNSKTPLGGQLRDAISDKFFEGELKTRALTAVAAMAASEVGLIAFQKYIRDVFVDFTPAQSHLLVPTFRWRAIVTTNFDLIVERAYQKSRGAIQTLVASWKDGDLFDNRMQETSDPVGYYKLHGCIDHYTDDSIPLVLGLEQYASYAANRSRFYSRLRDLSFDNPIIFCGYSIADPHIQQFLFDLTDRSIKRPQYYYVSPSLNDIETRYWAGNQVACVSATFGQFLQILDKKISPTARRLRRDVSADRLSIHTYYKSTAADESDSVRYYVQNDVVHFIVDLFRRVRTRRSFTKGMIRALAAYSRISTYADR